MEEGWWGDIDGESIFGALPLFRHMMPREKQSLGHNIVQCLIHISMAPLGAMEILYPEKGVV